MHKSKVPGCHGDEYFVYWHVLFVGPQCGTCLLPFWCLVFCGGSQIFEHLCAPVQIDSVTACFQGELKFWSKAANNIVRGKFSLSLVYYNSDFEDVQGCFISCFASSYSVLNKRMLNELKRRNCMFYSRHCHQLSAHLGKLGSTSDRWCCPELPYFSHT